MSEQPIAREWQGIQKFPSATQERLKELLQKLRDEEMTTLTILVMGKGGVGKSSTVNSVLGERVATVSAFQSEGLRPTMCSRANSGFTLNIIDTPGLIEGGYINEHAVQIIKGFLKGKTIDVLLYVDRLDAYRMDSLDRQVIRVITETFGKGMWRRALVVLTHAQLSPPDGLNYEDFVARRSEALLDFIRNGVGINKKEFVECPIPVVLVENSGRCKTNDAGEKILPDGTPWIPNLMSEIIMVLFHSKSKSIFVDQKLIDGPNPNDRWKMFIPIITVFQFLIVKGIQRSIQRDVQNEAKPLWEQRDLRIAKGEYDDNDD